LGAESIVRHVAFMSLHYLPIHGLVNNNVDESFGWRQNWDMKRLPPPGNVIVESGIVEKGDWFYVKDLGVWSLVPKSGWGEPIRNALIARPAQKDLFGGYAATARRKGAEPASVVKGQTWYSADPINGVENPRQTSAL